MMTEEHCNAIDSAILLANDDTLCDKVLEVAKVKLWSELDDSRFSGLMEYIGKLTTENDNG